MDSSSSKTSVDNQISQNGSVDSGISEDMKGSPEITHCTSDIKHLVAINNQDKVVQLPVSARKRNYGKRQLDDGLPETSSTFTSQEYLDKLSKLQQLGEKEKQLKIAIACEKLRKEQPVYLDTDILKEKIAEFQKLLQEVKSKNKMKNVMCVNLQLAKILQRVVGKAKGVYKQNGFSDTQRKCIEDLLRKKKDLNRRIGVKRKEIAKIDEDILKLGKTSHANKHTRSIPIGKCNLLNASTEMDHLELERVLIFDYFKSESTRRYISIFSPWLKENNQKFAERVHHLSWIIQSLVPYTERRWQEEPDLLCLMEECKNVSKCQFDDVDEMKDLLTSVCSISL